MILNKQAIRVIAAGLIGELTGQRIAKTLSYFNEKIGGYKRASGAAQTNDT